MADSLKIFGLGFFSQRRDSHFSALSLVSRTELEAQTKGGIATRTPSGHVGNNSQSATGRKLDPEVLGSWMMMLIVNNYVLFFVIGIVHYFLILQDV